MVIAEKNYMTLMTFMCKRIISKHFLTNVATDSDGLSSSLDTVNTQAVLVAAMFSILVQDSLVQDETEWTY